LQPLVSDRFVWRWTPDVTYSASSTYRSFFLGMSSMLGAKELWKASAPPKVKLFFWLALHGRIWMADRRKRHGLQDSAECALCGQDDETVYHLLVSCVFARELCHRHLLSFGWDRFAPAPGQGSPLGGSRLGGRCPKSCARASTRQCSSSLGACGRNATLGCSTMLLARRRKQRDGCLRRLRSGPLRGSRPFRCCWQPRQYLRAPCLLVAPLFTI